MYNNNDSNNVQERLGRRAAQVPALAGQALGEPMCIYVHMYIYIYIFIERERDR